MLRLLSQLLSSQADVGCVTQPLTSAAALDNVAASAPALEEPQRAKHASVDSVADATDSAGGIATRQQQSQQPDVSVASSSSQPAKQSASEGAAARTVARDVAVHASHSVASVYLPCVAFDRAASSNSDSSSAPLSCVDRLLSRIDFRAVTAGGTEFSLSAAQPSAAATELFAHFRQQARVASHWRAQQSAQHSLEPCGEENPSGGAVRKYRSGGGEVGNEGEEEKQQLTSSPHDSLEPEQLVRPVASSTAERLQKSRSGARRQADKPRQQSQR